MSKILVIGSLNADLVSLVPHIPKEGETISSIKFQVNFGGKGANQAIAASRLGADVSMIGKVGNDGYGKSLIENLNQSGVETKGIQVTDVPTGMAFINVSTAGENNIVLVPGANFEIVKADLDKYIDLIHQSDYIILQLEIPMDIIEYVLELASELGKKVILNPAPARPLSKEMLEKVHTIIPNESELEAITGMSASTDTEISKAASKLKSLGVKRVIVTVGDRGSYVINDETQFHVPANKVDVVDTTAAGDTYIAAFVVAITKGMDDEEAAKFASKVSSVAVTREGAQSSIPTLEEVETYFQEKNKNEENSACI